MMQLPIVQLDIRYNFQTKATANVLKAVLPSGRHIEFEVSEEEANALMAATQPEVDAQPATSQLVEWALLPDEILAPGVKEALHRAGLPYVVTEDELTQALRPIATVTESTTSYRHVDELGKVERGVPLPAQPRTRRVESDEAGNPVVVKAHTQPVDDGVDDDTGVRSV